MIRVEITESQNPAGKPLAVEAWVKADKPNGVVLARGGPSHGYALILSKGRPRFVVRVDSNVHAAGAKQNVVGKWVHLAGVLTPDKKLLIYVDGKLAAEGKTPGFIVSDPAQPMEIGADEAGAVGDYASPFALAATIDEVRVFHGTVTAEEIAQHAAGGKPAVKDAKLVCCYSFDKGDAKDESGNKNHGVVAAVKPAKGKVGGAMRFTGKAAASGSRGGRGTMKFQWSQQIPLLARAMVLTGKTLFVAGPRDLIDEDQTQNAAQDPDVLKKLAAQSDALEGKQGALLRAVSVDEGTKLAEMELPDAPVFDGLAAAGGRLFMVTTDGKIVCLGGK